MSKLINDLQHITLQTYLKVLAKMLIVFCFTVLRNEHKDCVLPSGSERINRKLGNLNVVFLIPGPSALNIRLYCQSKYAWV